MTKSKDAPLVNGMTWCDTCCAPMQLAGCDHKPYYVIDPRDEIHPSIPTIDGREKLIGELYHRLSRLLSAIETAEKKEDEGEDVCLTHMEDFFLAQDVLCDYWEWNPAEEVQNNAKAIIRRQNIKRQLPK